jgi:hypothetical protein
VADCAKKTCQGFLKSAQEWGMPKAISDAGSAGREGRAYVVLVSFILNIGIFLFLNV